ncbi:hypothetical protein SSX86_015594 [Deinandra increscens subsp. villosa]|uniref:non-specific serine/threonine protein kinase n=1 Tax=Deinandra increscens subsp. villosa TaxID=3103831 RepID=A0AAP0GXA9_9ASTR
MKWPESSKVYINQTLGLSECAEICERNCSCVAYANTDITGSGSGCVIWGVDLLDMSQYTDAEGGPDLYVRVAASGLESDSRNNVVKIVTIVGSTCTVIMILLIFFYRWKKKMQQSKNSTTGEKGPNERIHDFMMNEGVMGPSKRDHSSEMATEELELPLFDFTTLVTATNNFSNANKLGQGGFGSVYKGTLMGGLVVAVKRLSKTSGQGVEELKNEVRLIAKLQHRNLVRLLGCCIEVEEKLLVYEYMENKSLDMFLFDTKKSACLDWQKRFDIIFGIARGLLYLHQDSRFRIIHRDLKASNILLDKEMNPKISDFGLARIFGGNQTEAETKKVVGTHGYMSPEYAMDGIFSIKSDVYSFGVLLLEIVTGKKNKGFYYASQQLNLIGHIWNLWKEDNVLKLIDESIRAEFSEDEALRSIQIGLLCVQEHVEDRPNMSKVLLMLSSDVINLPQPKYSVFAVGKRGSEKVQSSKQDESLTLNEITTTLLVGRDAPINSLSGKLTMGNNDNNNGNIILLDQAETAVWTSNVSVPVGNYVAQLLYSGNFVLRRENDENPENYVWESFQNPTDSLLSGMKLRWERKTGVNRFLQSWKTDTDPASGDYFYKMNIDGFPEIFYSMKEKETGMKILYRTGPWNGKTFSGIPLLNNLSSLMRYEFLDNDDEISYSFEMKNTSSYSRLVTSSSGLLARLTWVESSQTWRQYKFVPRDQCDEYRKCGPFGVCDANALPGCKCMKGFRPKNQQAWDVADGSEGCVRISKMDCRSDGFMLQKNMKLPESSKAYVNRTLSLTECGEICRRNCSCSAYANTDITGSGSGCVIWPVDLLDMRQYEGGQDLYVRIASSDSDQSPTVGASEHESNNNGVKIVSVIVGTAAIIMILLVLFYIWRKKMQRSKNPIINRKGEMTTDELDLPFFDYTTLVIATNNFSGANKLGQGGFGCVYMGVMEGQVVAVKRLSRTSSQGIQEFTNEVRLIAKLQHRNLVRLLGCCIEAEEKLLVYEYMENKSLNKFLFEKSTRLDWQKRFNIIFGITRGLLYLHQDSRLRIIHRDLKASNILLDKEMNPKISDFGMARIFGGDQTEAETKKVVGTYGYMSPEYAMDGLFSIKSDVFSFGVLVLEIVSGKKNRGFYNASNQFNLIGHIWNLWKEGNALELIDESIGAEFSQDEVLTCIQIGLLCVQEHAEDRPNMSKVLLMLSSDVINLPQPKFPGFGLEKRGSERGFWSNHDESLSLNELSVTIPVATDSITPATPLTVNQTLVSSGQVFELGFFDPGNGNLYIGIWYKQVKPKTYVWVANRNTPVTSSSGKLTMGKNDNNNGNIILLDEAETAVWTSNISVPVGNGNTVAQLLDNGNFVLRLEYDENPENYIWESFKNPTDTLLPGMKLGWDRKTSVNRFLQSWKTDTDPGSGKYSFKMNIDGFPEIVLLKMMNILYRTGPWIGKRFSGVQQMNDVGLIEFDFEDNYNEISYSFTMKNTSVYSRLITNSSGFLQRFTWVEASQTWSLYWSLPRDDCDGYRKCGPFGVCDGNASPICKCMKGFGPKNQQAWDLRDGSDGCVRSSEMDCGSDGFMVQKNMKLPESSKAYVNRTLSLTECAEICKRNCSCAAYANTDITGSGSGCVIWTVDLLDMRQYTNSEGGQDLYVRAAASDLDQSHTVGVSENDSGNNVVKIVSITFGMCGVIIIVLVLFYMWKKKRLRSKNSIIHRKGETTTDELELPFFDFTTLVIATDNFSNAKKLGQGGFGCVYKGVIMERQVVAVKRLSRTSGQGIEEFTNEVRLIAKLQHRNLVRLLGCCIEVEEKLLVYEYMENKSLDKFLFDKEKSARLDWQKRFDIILGIARGLLYLHQDSRLRIIHRDLKASNILLDNEMNPKISDFGMARIFGGDQTEAKTKKVVGTYGYMSPEYAMDGLFSLKSDVFSFGILVLEIVSGKKNRGFYNASNQLNLIGHIWKLWKEGNASELIDESIGAEFSEDEVLTCIQIGLLCVQEHAGDRPNMSKVFSMLSSDITNLPQPKYPRIGLGKKGFERGFLSKHDESMSFNELSATLQVGR